jgi:hypothetical protein
MTKPALQKIHKGLLHIEEETRVRQDDSRQNKLFWASRSVNKEWIKLNYRGIKMTGNNRHLSVLTLNVNGLRVPIKRHRIANWVKKQDPTICCLQETHLTENNKHWLRSKRWKNVFQANGPHKQAGVAIS